MKINSVTRSLKELFILIKNSNYSKDQSIDYILSLLEACLDKSSEDQLKIIQSHIRRAKQGDFRFSSGLNGRQAEAKINRINTEEDKTDY
jgi:hypothetical protein